MHRCNYRPHPPRPPNFEEFNARLHPFVVLRPPRSHAFNDFGSSSGSSLPCLARCSRRLGREGRTGPLTREGRAVGPEAMEVRAQRVRPILGVWVSNPGLVRSDRAVNSRLARSIPIPRSSSKNRPAPTLQVMLRIGSLHFSYQPNIADLADWTGAG